MDKNEATEVKVCNKYIEAETVTEDSDNTSLSNFTDAISDVNPFLEGINKVKDLIGELEESFRESSNVGNNLILRCVLLRAENQNLVHKIDERKRVPPVSQSFLPLATLYNRQLQLSVLPQEKSKSMETNLRRIIYTNRSKSNLRQTVYLRNADEVDLLHKTIGDLQKKVREKDKRIESLCQELLDLNTNKKKMEDEYKSKISNLEKQLDVSYKTLSEFQDEMDAITGKNLSESKNTHEALFLQEKSRCRKLMYEKIRLNHEIKRLEGVIERQSERFENFAKGGNVMKNSLDKSSSEPYMKQY